MIFLKAVVKIFSKAAVKISSYFKQQEFRPHESSQDFFNARKAEKENVQSQLRLVEEHLMFSPDSPKLLIKKAKFLILLEEPMAAAEILREVIGSNPRNAEAISALAINFYHQGDLKRCIETCDKALQLNPSMEDTNIMRKNASNFSDVFAKLPSEFVELGIVFWEEKILLKGFQIDVNNKWAEQKLRTILAYSYLKNEQYKLCKSNITILLDCFEKTAELYIARAMCSMWETLDAEIDLMEAEKLNPTAEGLSMIATLKTDIMRNIGEMNIYSFFGVHPNSTVSHIRDAFEHLAKIYEDGLSKSLTKAAKRDIRMKLETAKKAFKVLSEETSRAEYDESLKRFKRRNDQLYAWSIIMLTVLLLAVLVLLAMLAFTSDET